MSAGRKLYISSLGNFFIRLLLVRIATDNYANYPSRTWYLVCFQAVDDLIKCIILLEVICCNISLMDFKGHPSFLTTTIFYANHAVIILERLTCHT